MHRATLRVLPSTMIAFSSAGGDSAPTHIRFGLRGSEKSEDLFARAEASGAIELRRATKLGPNCGERTNINFRRLLCCNPTESLRPRALCHHARHLLPSLKTQHWQGLYHLHRLASSGASEPKRMRPDQDKYGKGGSWADFPTLQARQHLDGQMGRRT